MTFKVRPFFLDLVYHLQKKRWRTVRSLATMVAVERWVQMEAAAMVDARRARYGIEGGTRNLPLWDIACERHRFDLWIAPAEGDPVAIEFKAIHNNKNLPKKAWELRHDLTVGRRLPSRRVSLHGIAVITYADYGPSSPYRPLRSPGTKTALPPKDFWKRLNEELCSPDVGAPKLRIKEVKSIVSLEGAPNVVRRSNSEVWLAHVVPKA
jgi:hypothetical protein